MTEYNYDIYRIRYCDEHQYACKELGGRLNWSLIEGFVPCGARGCEEWAIWIEKPFDEHGKVVE